MNRITIISTLSLFFSYTLHGQGNVIKQREMSIQYFGELGLHPGVEIDYLFNILEKNNFKEKRTTSHQINFRPSVAYYYLLKYTNNFLITPNINYCLKIINNKKKRYIFLEPYFKLGYLRYSYIGEIYQTTATDFEDKIFGGGNSFVFGGGLNLGGSIKLNILDWVIGSEYLSELSEDALFINHINIKTGIRFKIRKK